MDGAIPSRVGSLHQRNATYTRLYSPPACNQYYLSSEDKLSVSLECPNWFLVAGFVLQKTPWLSAFQRSSKTKLTQLPYLLTPQ